jgi:hypothetical protein
MNLVTSRLSFGLWPFLDFLGFFLLRLKFSDQSLLGIGIVHIGMAVQLLLNELIELHLLHILLSQLIIFIKLLRVLVP